MDDSTAALDRYLLTGEGAKPRLVERLLQAPAEAPAAAPFYRMLDAVGERVPDDALVALRLALTGRNPDDEAVLALRAAVVDARAHAAGTPEYEAARLRFHEVLEGP